MISQKTYMYNPQAQTTVWRQLEGTGWGMGGGGQWQEGNEDICNSVNNKVKK